MRQTFKSTKQEKTWLNEINEQRKQRSLELGIQAIDQLIQEKKKISYASVSQTSKLIDPEGKGIHTNTIKSNAELLTYFLDKRNKKYLKKKITTTDVSSTHFPNFMSLKPERDVARLKKQYLAMNKKELVDRLIQIEEYVAIHNKRWINEQFEKYNS